MTLTALIFCKIEHKAMKNVIEKLREIPQITKVLSLTGDYDILAELNVDSTDNLYDVFETKIDPIEGMISTNTHMVMKSWEK